MKPLSQKESGAYYTPDAVTESLLRWALRSEHDRLLDPSCGDGRFIAGHRNSVGIEQDLAASKQAMERAPWALVHDGDFFAWASNTQERFECAAGNPPFIRYQTFKGDVRDRALRLCAQVGAKFSGLSSSWAPFLVATASLLQPGGRMAFVVPAEIGHAPYSAPLIEYLAAHFAVLHVVAVRDKLFPELSEDCWLLYADGFGQQTEEIRFTALSTFRRMLAPPRSFARVSMADWRLWGRRLRPFLMPGEARSLYREIVAHKKTQRFGELANIGIGYVSGANDFFHLRPSDASRLRIPKQLLHPTVRNGRALPRRRLTASTVGTWHQNDEQVLLLRMPKTGRVPASVSRYLDSEAGVIAREAYKCRVREPWYSVPDVQIPDFFLSYMSGLEANLVRNDAGCTCTNSVHSVRLREGVDASSLLDTWESPFVKLSTELEGHPLGGGMLKLEPREATQVVLPSESDLLRMNNLIVAEALTTLREWRHYAVAQ
ncbi:SAM-dependent DNA methyltransferase [Paraburkholderia panacisoli]|uniref:site-specific DNA-methyltransferase (adenine-specific) n=1 Tax=Paraburkholderia panacisoli TaxID=2603818 RepID=A0A5B0HCE6_9BURK|nr:SAM-dependent DNA methyltransferase [Paraburkholderia panacisoli]KAA1012624.1 SAM-dependent DNA methyltransferase [Paraburkholderia panacisoli]